MSLYFGRDTLADMPLQIYQTASSKKLEKDLVFLQLQHAHDPSLQAMTVFFLLDWEKRFGGVKNPRFPFEGIMQKCSPTFSRFKMLAEQMGVKVVYQFHSPARMVMEWNPYAQSVLCQDILPELTWLSKQSLRPDVSYDVVSLMRLNKNQFHDYAHSVFFRLLPPPRSLGVPLKKYFLFVEALVCAVEYLVALELGSFLAQNLVSFQCLSRSLAAEHRYLKGITTSRDLFEVALTQLLARFQQVPFEKVYFKNPKHRYCQAPSMQSSDLYVKELFPLWLKAHQNDQYPASWRKSVFKIPPLIFNDFSYLKMMKRNEIHLVIDWYFENFSPAKYFPSVNE